MSIGLLPISTLPENDLDIIIAAMVCLHWYTVYSRKHVYQIGGIVTCQRYVASEVERTNDNKHNCLDHFLGGCVCVCTEQVILVRIHHAAKGAVGGCSPMLYSVRDSRQPRLF